MPPRPLPPGVPMAVFLAELDDGRAALMPGERLSMRSRPRYGAAPSFNWDRDTSCKKEA